MDHPAITYWREYLHCLNIIEDLNQRLRELFPQFQPGNTSDSWPIICPKRYSRYTENIFNDTTKQLPLGVWKRHLKSIYLGIHPQDWSVFKKDLKKAKQTISSLLDDLIAENPVEKYPIIWHTTDPIPGRKDESESE
jgi:hypothetical protein